MYRGKHETPATGMKKYKKSGILIASLVLILVLTVGTTLAYLIDVTDPVQNIFNPSEITVDIEEEFNNKSKTSVVLRNEGDISAYLRATVASHWTYNGAIVPAPSGFENVPVISYNTTDWMLKDGFYYYKNAVTPNGTTSNLLASAVTLTDIPSGYAFHMEVLGEAIQAEPVSVVESSWGVTVTNGVITG